MVELDCVTTPRKRAATVERVAVAVVLKYSWNLDAEPDEAAVAAAEERLAELDSAVLSADSCELEQLLV